MDSCTLTVFFDGQFWVGLFTKDDGTRYSAYRHIFGQEPSDAEIYQFIRGSYLKIDFSASVTSSAKPKPSKGFKKKLRLARQALAKQEIGTKAQIALKEQQEKSKIQQKIKTRNEIKQKQIIRFRQKRLKAKKKHRGK
jgi:hypothetical protein